VQIWKLHKEINMAEKNFDDKARIIQAVANDLGWGDDIPNLINRVKQMDKGLISEDEFTFFLNWSKKCKLIHKLDQYIIPQSAKSEFTIPDLFVIFNQNGVDYPCYIEVKTSKENRLSWTKKVYEGYLNYSKATGMPVLVAWKWSTFDIWTLFNIEDFEINVTNYKIGFEQAHKKNLLSKLAGDFLIIPHEEFSFSIKYKKIILEKQGKNETVWKTIVESFVFKGFEGKEISRFSSGLFSLLFSFQLEKEVKETETHVEETFIPNTTPSCFAQSVLIRMVNNFEIGEVNWLTKIKEQKFLIDYDKFVKDMKQAIQDDLIRYIFYTFPESESTKTTNNEQ
jgi:Holliday junction resolvase